MTGTAALLAALAALLAGCTRDPGSTGTADDAKPEEPGVSAAPAPPGKYRTLPEPCGEVEHSTLDAMLPGIKAITDERQRENAYEGTATLTYDTDRRVGCRWTGESGPATDHLFIDFERVVSYDTTVSDDSEAQQVFVSKETDAGLQVPADPGKGPQKGGTPSGEGMSPDSTDAGGADTAGDSCAVPGSGAGAGAPGGTSGAGGLASRALGGLGDAAFLDDTCSSPSSAARHRTVTVVFRTSNVIVTVEYDEQPSNPALVPDSKEMQDTVQELAHKLAGKLSE
ncbi:DUF3558 domain-containing protein [Streptomyces sulfonofaciens]|uniref:DUF3558 domain-containing protein n=1 Tax=Streptomyces sulfonofaciens TaxID=68272 RepID=UPI0027E3DDB2|nr:DUF3558 domain-containing protein [Streptomyces sulfonofaciens]